MRAEDRAAWMRADACLEELLELEPEARRRALDELAVEAAVRIRLASLLEAAERDDGPLDREPAWTALVDAGAAPPVPSAGLAGRRFGAYLLDEEIGRGGMAVVYAAHRADGAFAQSVAVKVLGSGLLPTSAASRFHREQELLARLRHPNIANLLDGGVAEDGTPFLVMERIEGLPIDRYCDDRGLEQRGRVALLLQVCEAVAYAHRNLVVHRDLKPGNILVTTEGAAKLLDFGIAKLLDPETGPGDGTELRSRLLTPRYAAPEQIEGGTVTTATDVFGLGKVLERLLGAAADDVDLANIRRRAIHLEPERRYADARALAEDLERWLAGRPVVATPDSWTYRTRKWASRHRAALAAAGLIVAVGAAGLVASLTQARRATREARTSAAINTFLTDLFQAHDPDAAGGDDPPASELFRRGAAKARSELADSPALQAELLTTIGRIQVERGLYDDAETSLTEALRLRLSLQGERGHGAARVRRWLADLQHQKGDVPAGIATMRQALSAFDREGPESDPERLGVVVALAELLTLQESYEEARELSRAVLDLSPAAGLAADSAVASAYQVLGIALHGLGDLDGSAATLEKGVEFERQRPGSKASQLAIYLNDLSLTLLDLHEYDRAEAALVESLAIKRRQLGDRHIQTITAITNLAFTRNYQGRVDEALAGHREALALTRQLFPPQHPETIDAVGAMAIALGQAHRPAEALPLFAEALSLARALDPPKRPSNHPSHAAHFGFALLELDRPIEAEIELREAISIYESREGQGGPRIHFARARLGEALAAQGRWSEAADELHRCLPQLAETSYGWGRPSFTRLMVLGARAWLEAGEAAEAERALAELRRRFEAHPEEGPPETMRELDVLEARLATVR